jgi:hypothetical protein
VYSLTAGGGRCHAGGGVGGSWGGEGDFDSKYCGIQKMLSNLGVHS